MNLSKLGKRVWWGFLVLAITVVVSFRLKAIFSGQGTQIDFYLLFLWVALLLTPLFSEVDILGVKIKKETAETKEKPASQQVKNHVLNIYQRFVSEPDLLKLQRYLFIIIQLTGLFLLIRDNYIIGGPLVLTAVLYGEFYYKDKITESRAKNQSEIVAYLKQNNLFSREKLTALSNQILVRSQEPMITNTKVSVFLTLLLAPYYLKAIDLFIIDKEILLSSLSPIFAYTIVLMIVILYAPSLTSYILWFMKNKQQIYNEISWFITEEVMIDRM